MYNFNFLYFLLPNNTPVNAWNNNIINVMPACKSEVVVCTINSFNKKEVLTHSLGFNTGVDTAAAPASHVPKV